MLLNRHLMSLFIASDSAEEMLLKVSLLSCCCRRFIIYWWRGHDQEHGLGIVVNYSWGLSLCSHCRWFNSSLMVLHRYSSCYNGGLGGGQKSLHDQRRGNFQVGACKRRKLRDYFGLHSPITSTLLLLTSWTFTVRGWRRLPLTGFIRALHAGCS